MTEIRDSLAEIKFVKPKTKFNFFSLKEGKMPGEAYLDPLRAHVKALAPVAALFAVTCVVISSVHTITDLDTARAEAREQRELLSQVMPQAETSSETPYRANGALSILAGYSSEGELVGYCVEVQNQGFGGIITMVVGVDLDGKVTGVAVTPATLKPILWAPKP